MDGGGGMYHYIKCDENGNIRRLDVLKTEVISGGAAYMMNHDLSREQLQRRTKR